MISDEKELRKACAKVAALDSATGLELHLEDSINPQGMDPMLFPETSESVVDVGTHSINNVYKSVCDCHECEGGYFFGAD